MFILFKKIIDQFDLVFKFRIISCNSCIHMYELAKIYCYLMHVGIYYRSSVF